MPVTDSHPLRRMLDSAVVGAFPPSNGTCCVLPPDATGTCGVVAFTGHAVVLCDLTADDPVLAGLDGFGSASRPEVLLHLAGSHGRVGTLDVVLVRTAGGVGASNQVGSARFDVDGHPRVARARHHRTDVEVFGDERGIVTFGCGLVGRTEISVELTGAPHSGGAGRALVQAGLSMRSPDESVFAQVAPGNAASLRMFLACGFAPIGSEVLIEHG
ncbi:MAG: hypothetical protein ABIO83_09920 [Ilumatobacteraceae bacterium]